MNFPRNVTGFTIDDPVANNGTLGNFSGSGADYSVEVTPSADGEVTLDVAAGVCQDEASQPNVASVQFSIQYSSYMKSILDLSPLAYWPMSETSGQNVYDHTGNARNAVSATGVTLAQAGISGNAYLFPGVGEVDLIANDAFRTAMDTREFAIACWFYAIPYTYDPNKHPRLMEQWMNNASEYFALELANHTEIQILLQEDNDSRQNKVFGNWAANTWHHIAAYNTESGGYYGVYIDGVLYEEARTDVEGSTLPVSTGYPFLFRYLKGYAQHVVWLDHKPSQAEVDVLYAGGNP